MVRATPQTQDDGAYGHLEVGSRIPRVSLPATSGETLDVVAPTEFTALFLYPMTGTPGQRLPDGWLGLPGAFGCTAEACGYRDLHDQFRALGATVFGVSTQTTAEQREFAAREHIPYPFLSDSRLLLVQALRLPTFSVEGQPPRIKRATLIVDREGTLRRLLYPVPEPAADAEVTLAAIQGLRADPPG
ncbi:MAG: peroxiredoxin [Actinomycetota bacterium]|nr:peroxiredoxin [Actinomycetota bacterium]